jgi:hypothetical protein
MASKPKKASITELNEHNGILIRRPKLPVGADH